MEKAEIIAVSVVGLIAAAEIICLYICSKNKKKSYPLCTVLPVTADDTELSERLECIATLIEDGSSFIGTVLLIDFDGTAEQISTCRDFCSEYNSAKLISEEEICESIKNVKL